MNCGCEYVVGSQLDLEVFVLLQHVSNNHDFVK
jgi:hypothetical protein